jgi:hypothetical protein
MSPDEYGDLHLRLGYPVAAESEERTISPNFPPFTYTSKKSNLVYRVGGFKAVNDYINELQTLLKYMTGQIRTKMMEWDISMYLQHPEIPNRFDAGDPTTHSLTLGIFEDGPLFGLEAPSVDISPGASPWRDFIELLKGLIDAIIGKIRPERIAIKSLIWGNINAAVSAYRRERWWPTIDPDLKYWQPPTDNLEATRKSLQPFKKKKSRGMLWWHEEWEETIYPEIPEDWSPEQKLDFEKAVEAKWSSWAPEYWELFFLESGTDANGRIPPHITNYSVTELSDRIERVSKKKKAKRAGDLDSYVSGSKSEGINLKSPFFFGRPYGRKKDPRSLESILKSTKNSIPSLFNDSLFPEWRPIDQFNNYWDGWNSTVKVRSTRTVPWKSNTGGSGYYTTPTSPTVSYNPDTGDSETSTTKYVSEYRDFTSLFQAPFQYSWVAGANPSNLSGKSLGSLKIQKPSTDYPWWNLVEQLGKLFGKNPPAEMRWSYSSLPPGLTTILNKIEDLTRDPGSSDTHSYYDGSTLQGTLATGTYNEGRGIPALMYLEDDNYTYIVEVYITAKSEWKNRKKKVKILFIEITVDEQYEVRFFAVRPMKTIKFPKNKSGSPQEFIDTSKDTYAASFPSEISDIVNKTPMRIKGVFFKISEALQGLVGTSGSPVYTGDIVTDIVNRFEYINDGISDIQIPLNAAKALSSTFLYTRKGKKMYSAWTLSHNLISEVKEVRDKLAPVMSMLEGLGGSSEELVRIKEAIHKSAWKESSDLVSAYNALKASVPLISTLKHSIGASYDKIDQLAALSKLELLEYLYAPITDGGLITKKPQGMNELRNIMGSFQGVLQAPALVSIVENFLTVLYYYRLELFKKRLNKEDGTLINLARMEFTIEVLEANLEQDEEELEAITNNSDILSSPKVATDESDSWFIQAAPDAEIQASTASKRRAIKVYSPVQYEDEEKTKVIYPESGYYRLVSKEYLNKNLTPPVEFFIVFEEGNTQTPKIIKNVLAGLDLTVLQELQPQPQLSAVDKLCASRVLEDWWEIVIPEAKRPLAEYYQSEVSLLRVDALSSLFDARALLGNKDLSPIVNVGVAPPHINAVWGLSPQAQQESLEQFQGEIMKTVTESVDPPPADATIPTIEKQDGFIALPFDKDGR